MMRINQFSNASMFQTQTAQMQGNNRAANQSFKTSLQNNSQAVQGMQTGNNQPGQPRQIAGQQNNIQPTAPEGFSGFSGVINIPEMPEMPDGEMPPAKPEGEEEIDGGMGMQRPDDLPEIPAGEEPPAKPDESDGEMGYASFSYARRNAENRRKFQRHERNEQLQRDELCHEYASGVRY